MLSVKSTANIDLSDMSEASDGYSEDFDEEIDTDPENRAPYHTKQKARRITPALRLYKPEGQVKEFTSNMRNRQVANRGANSLPILGRGDERGREGMRGVKEPNVLRHHKRLVSHDAGKPPSDRVLSANLRTIRSLQSSLKEKEVQMEQLVRENRLYKRYDILTQKEVTRMEREHKSVPELIKRHEIEIALQKERFKKLLKDQSDFIRRKEQLERELGLSKLKFTELKKISENKKLEERHQLSLRLQEEIDRSAQLSQLLQEASKKLAFQEKSTKREKAELEEKCKKREKRISLMEHNVREMDLEMRTKKKQLEKLNLYSLRIEKNLPANMNLSDFLPSQEDRGTMTSPTLLPSDSIQSKDEPRFSLPPTRSQNLTSNSIHIPRTTTTQIQRQSLPPPTNTSGVNSYTIKPQYPDVHSTTTPPMTYSEPGNYSESDTMPTFHTSSDLTNLTANPTPTEAKSTPNSNGPISPPIPPIPADPPLSTIREISTFIDNSSVHHSLRKSLQHDNTHTFNNSPAQYNSGREITQPVRKQPSENQLITSTQKEALLKRLKEIDTNESASMNESQHTESTQDSQSLRDSERRPDNLASKTLALKTDALSGDSTPVNNSQETGGRGRKKKTLALDDLFSGDSTQNSESKLQASNNMDPGLFTAPRQDSPIHFNKLRQFPEREENSPKNKPSIFQENSAIHSNDPMSANELSKKPSVVENMFHGKPAYSTEEDFYGSKFVQSPPSKTSNQNPFQFDSSKKPQHGRRARDADPLTQTDGDYYWENKVTPAKPSNSRRVATPVDDMEDDLEVIQL